MIFKETTIHNPMSYPGLAKADLFSFQQVTGSTHKYLGLEEVVESHPQARAFCVISSGNRLRDLRRILEEKGLSTPIYPLVNSPNGWENEIIMEERRILRDGAERAEYVGLRTGIAPEHIVDVTDAQSPRLVEALAEHLTEGNHTAVFVPAGGCGLYLAAVRAADTVLEQTGRRIRVTGFAPQGENGIFLDPEKEYELRDGKLYYRRFEPKSLMDKLPCPYTIYRDEVLETFARGHRIVEFTEAQARQAYVLASMAFAHIEPSSAAGAIGLLPDAWDKKIISGGDRALVLITGTTQQASTSYDPMRRLFATKEEFFYQMANNYGDLDFYEGRWKDDFLQCTLRRSWAMPEECVVHVPTLVVRYQDGSEECLLKPSVHDQATAQN